MSDVVVKNSTPPKRGRGLQPLSRIDLPGSNDWWELRTEFGEKRLGVCDKTVARMGLETMYIKGFAYVLHNKSLQTLADRARRRNEPGGKRRRPSRTSP